MVTLKDWDGKPAYACQICRFCYRDKKVAAMCERYCKEYKSCSMDIVKFALNRVV